MTFTKAFTACAFAAVAALVAGSPAEAGTGRQLFMKEYTFAKPMHGYSGHAGNYYCDYQRVPQRQCVIDGRGNEHCKIVAWTLRELCQ